MVLGSLNRVKVRRVREYLSQGRARRVSVIEAKKAGKSQGDRGKEDREEVRVIESKKTTKSQEDRAEKSEKSQDVRAEQERVK